MLILPRSDWNFGYLSELLLIKFQHIDNKLIATANDDISRWINVGLGIHRGIDFPVKIHLQADYLELGEIRALPVLGSIENPMLLCAAASGRFTR
jgi:hypothetical protein